MCSTRSFYRIEIMREIPGTNNFVRSCVMPGQFNIPDVIMPEITLPLASICNTDKSARIKFVIVSNNGVEFNSGITTINDLVAGRTALLCSHNTTMVLNDFSVFVKPTFVDYLRAGWAISLVAAIDYTASNGNPSDRSSLHFLGE